MEQTTSHVVCTNSSVLNSTTLLASPSQPKKVEGKKVPLVGKIPVVISEADVQVYVDATIQLDDPALEITRVKKNVFLTRSQLLLTDDKKSSKLLISGFVRNCIEYSTANSVGQSSVSGKIRFTVVNIPFKCFTKVDFITEPVVASNPQQFTSSALSPDGLGSDQYAISITNSEIMNEKIYCELIESKIRQIDLKKDIELLAQPCGKHTNERTFKTFLESMVIELKLRVMQNQSVFISHSSTSSCDGRSDDGKVSGRKCSSNSDNESCKDNGKDKDKDDYKDKDKDKDKDDCKDKDKDKCKDKDKDDCKDKDKDDCKDKDKDKCKDKDKDDCKDKDKDKDKDDCKDKDKDKHKDDYKVIFPMVIHMRKCFNQPPSK